ncbi:MAG: hypothetical protein Q7S54_00535, partial [bacterium]|nr:hypothetical protein [bacterium]
MPETNLKIKKIASAIYLITGFFNDLEPLKWKLRSLSSDLVSESVKDKSSIARDIKSLFTIAKHAGLVSDANHDILIHEISKLQETLDNPLGKAFLPEPVSSEKAIAPPRLEDNLRDKNIIEKVAYLPKEPIEKHLKEFGAVSVKKNSRQSIIIGLLKRKKEIMIKDVSPLIGGCSEKTIQRELLAMVQAG